MRAAEAWRDAVSSFGARCDAQLELSLESEADTDTPAKKIVSRVQALAKFRRFEFGSGIGYRAVIQGDCHDT